MSDEFDPRKLKDLPPSPWRKTNVVRYVNQQGRECESCELVDEAGNFVGCIISTNVERDK